MKTTPLAVAGRCRATTIPATLTRVAVRASGPGPRWTSTSRDKASPDQLHRVLGRASSPSSGSRPRSGPTARAAAAAGAGDPSSGSASCAPSSVRAARAEPPASQRAGRLRSSSGSTGVCPHIHQRVARSRPTPAAGARRGSRARASGEVRDAAIARRRGGAPRSRPARRSPPPRRRIPARSAPAGFPRARLRSGRLNPAVELADVDVRRQDLDARAAAPRGPARPAGRSPSAAR